jgi:hypothetical protein
MFLRNVSEFLPEYTLLTVDIATEYVLGGFAFPVGARLCFSVEHPVWPWDPLSLLPQWVPGGRLFPRG